MDVSREEKELALYGIVSPHVAAQPSLWTLQDVGGRGKLEDSCKAPAHPGVQSWSKAIVRALTICRWSM